MSINLKLEDSKKLGGTKFTLGFELLKDEKKEVTYEKNINC